MATTLPPPATKPKAGFEQPEQVPFHRIRITLSSRNVKSLEKGTCFYKKSDVYVFSLRRSHQGSQGPKIEG